MLTVSRWLVSLVIAATTSIPLSATATPYDTEFGDRCRPLTSRYVDMTLTHPTAVDVVVKKMLRGTGWDLDFRTSMVTPSIKGQLIGTVRAALDRILSAIDTKGYHSELQLHDCRVALTVTSPNDVVARAADRGVATVSTAPSGSEPSDRLVRDWLLNRGAMFNEELARWGQLAGWRVVWKPSVSWRVFETARFHGDFLAAVRQVVEVVRQQGRLLSMTAYRGNKVLELDLSSGDL